MAKHTTSIVDISEIEDDEAPLTAAAANGGQQQPQQQPQQQQTSRPTSQHHNLYLYHEDSNPHQRIPNLLSTMINTSQPSPSNPPSPGQTWTRAAGQGGNGNGCQLGLVPAIDYQPTDCLARPDSAAAATTYDPAEQRPTTPAAAAAATTTTEPEQSKANLGTLSGVYFPCVQNIFGVILFIRMVWIVGTAGVPAAFTLVFICCCVTLTTSISLSAIATNGIVPAGGSYFMISRSLGPECGGAVGTMFFLGTTFAGAMYITGAVEIMLNYMAPSWGLFGDFQRDVNILYHNIRVYGTLLLIIVGCLVWIGVRFVSKLAPIALFCVLFSIASIYAGIFINYNGRPDLMICVLGDRLVSLKNIPFDDPTLPMGQLDPELAYGPPGGGAATNGIGGVGAGPTSASGLMRNGSKLMSASEQAAYREMRRTKALCTYEKLRYIYCPNELARGKLRRNQLQQQQQQQQQFQLQEATAAGEAGGDANGLSAVGNGGEQQSAGEISEADQMREIFKYAPNMSNCDAYFRANKDRIHLEKAVPGE